MVAVCCEDNAGFVTVVVEDIVVVAAAAALAGSYRVVAQHKTLLSQIITVTNNKNRHIEDS